MKLHEINLLKILYTAVVLLFSFYQSDLHAQTSHSLLHPSYFDYFRHAQFQPNGGIRVVGLSEQYNGNYITGREVIFADILPHPYMDSLLVRKLDSFSIFIYDTSFLLREHIGGFVTLPFADGSTLIAVDGFDCDFGFAGGMCLLSPAGEIEWQYSFIDSLDSAYPQEILFVNKDVIGLISYYDTLLINRSGQVLHQPIPQFPYSKTYQTSTGFVVSNESALYVLDTLFQVRRMYDLNSTIRGLSAIGDSCFLITTDEELYLLLGTDYLEVLPTFMNDFDLVWRADSTYWGIKQETQEVQQWNAGFNALSQHALPIRVHPNVSGYHMGESFVGAQYATPYMGGIMVYQSPSPSIDLRIPFDIGVTWIALLDTVFRTPGGNPFGGNWIYQFGRLDVEVTNFGIDTVFQFVLQGKYPQYCDWCPRVNSEWVIDTLPIPPGENALVRIPDYSSPCVFGNVTSVCITSLSPDLKADGYQLNDEACQSFMPITVSTPDVEAPQSWTIRPNPAQTEIWIEGDDLHSGISGCIADVSGRIVREFCIQQNMQYVNLDGLSDGFYIISLANLNVACHAKPLIVYNRHD